MGQIAAEAIPGTEEHAERLSYLGITAETSRLLRDFWPIVAPALQAILEEFYNHVSKTPALAALIGNQRARLMKAQSMHWETLFSGRFDQDNFDSVRALRKLLLLAARQYPFSRAQSGALSGAVTTAVLLDVDLSLSTYQ